MVLPLTMGLWQDDKNFHPIITPHRPNRKTQHCTKVKFPPAKWNFIANSSWTLQSRSIPAEGKAVQLFVLLLISFTI
jgi:hypothetical protein